MMKEACLEGVGTGLLPQLCCDAEIKQGGLVHILPENPTAPEFGVYVVYPEKSSFP